MGDKILDDINLGSCTLLNFHFCWTKMDGEPEAVRSEVCSDLVERGTCHFLNLVIYSHRAGTCAGLEHRTRVISVRLC